MLTILKVDSTSLLLRKSTLNFDASGHVWTCSTRSREKIHGFFSVRAQPNHFCVAMSWSMSYTSKMGLVKDSYHRIPLIVDLSASSGVDVAELESLERIVADGMKHIFFRVAEEYSSSGATQVVQNLEAYLERLQDANLVYNLYVTMYCANGEFIHDDAFVQRVCRRTESPKNEIDIGCLVVSLLCEEVPDKEAENYHDVIKRFGVISTKIREHSENIKIGISDCFHRKTLQHLFEAYPAQIAVAIPCDVNFPNFRCRNIEYIHSQGYAHRCEQRGHSTDAPSPVA